MCALPVSPGVYTQIIDQSEYVQQTGGTTGFTLVLSESGEDNTLVFVSTQTKLINKFGSPNMKLYGQSLYNAMEFLGVSGSFYLVRPLPTVEDTGDLITSLPAATPMTPWVNKPATFAGKVIGYVVAQDTKSEENVVYFDNVIEAVQIYTVSTSTLPLSINITNFSFTNQDTIYVYVNTTLLSEGENYTRDVVAKKINITSYNGLKNGDVIRIFKRNNGYFDFSQFDVSGPVERYVTVEMDASFYADPTEPTTLTDNKAAGFVLLPLWDKKIIYSVNDIVTLNGYKYTSLTNNNKGNDPTISFTEENISNWNFNTVYNSGDIVRTDIGIYRSLIDNNSAINNLSEWDSNTTYNIDNIIYTSSGIYRSLIDNNLGNNPSSSPDSWERLEYYTLDDSTKWELLPIYWYREEVLFGDIVEIKGTQPIIIYLPFLFIPGQNQLTVKIDGSDYTNYTELSTGTAISIPYDSQFIGKEVVVEKFGVVPLVRFTNKFLDPVTDESTNTNFRNVATDIYSINNKPLANSWLIDKWTYNFNSLSSSTVLNTFKPLIVFSAKGRGKYGNKFIVRISPTFNIDNHYILSVNLYNPLVNTEVTLEQFTVSFIPGASINPGESSFIEDVVNSYSEYIYVYTDPDELARLSKMIDSVESYYKNGNPSVFTDPSSSTPATILDRLLSVYYTVDPDSKQVISTVPIYFTGGHEGCLIGIDGQSINNTVFLRCFSYAARGIYDSKVLDTDSVFIDVVYDANFPQEIKYELLELCRRRGDCYLEADLSKAVSVKQAVDNRLKKDTFNSYLVSYTAPFAKITSVVEGKEIVVAPSYFMASLIPNNDAVSEIWFAAFGPNRGVINTPIKKLLFTPDSQGDYDLLYLNQINPIVYKNGRYMLYSQLTSQRKASALQDKNIVRLILYLNRVLKRAAFEYIGEPNDRLTWSAVQNNLSQILADIARRRGLYSYKVTVSASDYEIKQKMFHVNVVIQPTRTTEKILLNFIVR